MVRKSYYRSDSTLEIGCFFFVLLLFIIPIVLFIYSGINAFNEFKSLPDQPQHTTLAESSSLLNDKGVAWVIIDDLVWDCSHIFQETQVIRGGRGPDIVIKIMHIPFTNKQHNIFGETRLTDNLTLTCDEIKSQEVVGVLESESDLMMSHHLFYEGFDYSKYTVNGKSLLLCHTCGGKDTARRDLIISMTMILILLLPIFVILFWRF